MLLRVGVAKEVVDSRAGGVLFKQALKYFSPFCRLAGAHQSGAPGEEQRGIIGRISEQWPQHPRGLGVIFQHEVA